MSKNINIVNELKSRAEVISSALKTAFGGASQVPVTTIGLAVAGQINNNGLCCGTVEDLCAAVVAAFDGESEYETPLDQVVQACKEALERVGFPWEDLPYKAW